MEKKTEEEGINEEWVLGMRDYIAPKGRLNAEHLGLVLLQVKERLDTQMDSAVIVAAVCDLLIAKGVATEKEIDNQVAKLAKDLSQQ